MRCRTHALAAGLRADPLAELLVIQQGTMRIEDLRFRPTQFSLYALLQTHPIFGATLKRGFEPTALFIGHRRRDPVMRDRDRAASDDMGPASGQAG